MRRRLNEDYWQWTEDQLGQYINTFEPHIANMYGAQFVKAGITGKIFSNLTMDVATFLQLGIALVKPAHFCYFAEARQRLEDARTIYVTRTKAIQQDIARILFQK